MKGGLAGPPPPPWPRTVAVSPTLVLAEGAGGGSPGAAEGRTVIETAALEGGRRRPSRTARLSSLLADHGLVYLRTTRANHDRACYDGSIEQRGLLAALRNAGGTIALCFCQTAKSRCD